MLVVAPLRSSGGDVAINARLRDGRSVKQSFLLSYHDVVILRVFRQDVLTQRGGVVVERQPLEARVAPHSSDLVFCQKTACAMLGRVSHGAKPGPDMCLLRARPEQSPAFGGNEWSGLGGT